MLTTILVPTDGSDRAEKAIDLAGRRMASQRDGQPSKPDDLSLILFRKPNRTPA